MFWLILDTCALFACVSFLNCYFSQHDQFNNAISAYHSLHCPMPIMTHCAPSEISMKKKKHSCENIMVSSGQERHHWSLFHFLKLAQKSNIYPVLKIHLAASNVLAMSHYQIISASTVIVQKALLPVTAILLQA